MSFRYAFHVAEVLTVAALVMVDDIQTPYKTPTEYGIDGADMFKGAIIQIMNGNDGADVRAVGGPC